MDKTGISVSIDLRTEEEDTKYIIGKTGIGEEYDQVELNPDEAGLVYEWLTLHFGNKPD